MRRLIAGLVTACAVALLSAPSAGAAFGLSNFEVSFTNSEGSLDLQAGSHPFAMTTSFGVNSEPLPGGGAQVQEPLKTLEINQVEGLAGNPTAAPACSRLDFLTPLLMKDGFGSPTKSKCADGSVVGTVAATLGGDGSSGTIYSPVYNVEPPPGAAMEIGFRTGTVPTTIVIGLTEGLAPRVQAAVRNLSQALEIVSTELTLWGVPADPAHDPIRGRCLTEGGDSEGDSCSAGVAEAPFLTLPRACGGPLATNWEAASWLHPESWVSGDSGSSISVDNCGRLGFAPEITAKPTSVAAQSSSGLDFSLDAAHNEGLTNHLGYSNADIEKTVVTLPEGMTVNPSSANGLGVCTEAQLAEMTAFTDPGVGCPNASKLGNVEVETPLLEAKILRGSLFLGVPYENREHSLISLYVVIQDPGLGIFIVQPLRVELDPVTGRLVTTAEAMPLLPFSHFRLHFREGARSPLVTPSVCGSDAVAASLYPSNGAAPVQSTSTFEIISGPEAGPCPSGGTPPFHPGLEAGTNNNAAGSYSPFNVHLSRTDGEQEITHFSIKLPPGVTGKLAGIPFCSDADVAAARARERQPHGGQEELDHPSCPQASEVGHTLVGAGVGSILTYVPGKVYLAGPYQGSNLSIVAITAAKAGPFDLGTVVIREALKVNPETAEVSVDAGTSDPIPHIVNGIPVHLRDIRVYVDRPEFVRNPTNCEPTSTASTVLGSGTDFASEADDRPVTVTSRFQAADCASLGFKPGLKISLKGPTGRAGLPALTAVVTPRAGDANIGKAVVTLPPSEFLEQAHIGNSCTRVQFNSGAGNGAGCPANSVLGHAVAVTPLLDEPLEGPVFLRSNGGERKLPDLVAALHSTDINIDLVGFIDSLHKKGSDVSQIRTTFAKVPDQPVTRFTLKMSGGKKGLLVNSTNLCKGTHKAISEFTGQNGVKLKSEPVVQAQCGKKKGKKGAKKSKAKSRPALLVLHTAGW
jgi:hypothetical protein